VHWVRCTGSGSRNFERGLPCFAGDARVGYGSKCDLSSTSASRPDRTWASGGGRRQRYDVLMDSLLSSCLLLGHKWTSCRFAFDLSLGARKTNSISLEMSVPPESILVPSESFGQNSGSIGVIFDPAGSEAVKRDRQLRAGGPQRPEPHLIVQASP
jgi:hypothetical protein